MPYPKGYCYLPGIIYDLAFKIMLRGVRRRVARTVERERLYPWLDVCSGTGDQLRVWTRRAVKRARRSLGKHRPSTHVPFLSSASSQGAGLEGERFAVGLDMHFGFVRYAAARAPEIPFVCGDAVQLPFKNGSARAVSISFGLHDKDPETRNAIVQEARRALGPEGKLIAVDFENPWSAKSRMGALFVWAIERLAGGEHYRNGREFLRNGGLRAFLGANGFVEVDRRDVEAGSIGIVVARPMN
jgi:ubiquinone/menaquinone biosynthesis C-methylase UbiE